MDVGIKLHMLQVMQVVTKFQAHEQHSVAQKHTTLHSKLVTCTFSTISMPPLIFYLLVSILFLLAYIQLLHICVYFIQNGGCVART